MSRYIIWLATALNKRQFVVSVWMALLLPMILIESSCKFQALGLGPRCFVLSTLSSLRNPLKIETIRASPR